MSDDYLETALKRADDDEAARRHAAERETHEAATPHPRDPELGALLANFASRMPHDSAIPFIAHPTVQDPPSRRLFGRKVTPPLRSERCVRAHGWVIPGFGRKIYATNPPNAGAMAWLGLGVTTVGEPMFVTSGAALVEASLGPFTFQKLDMRDHPLCAKALGPITIENKCGAILSTLQLHYEDLSAEPVEEQPRASAVVFIRYPTAPDPAKEMLAALAAAMAKANAGGARLAGPAPGSGLTAIRLLRTCSRPAGLRFAGAEEERPSCRTSGSALVAQAGSLTQWRRARDQEKAMRRMVDFRARMDAGSHRPPRAAGRDAPPKSRGA